MRDLKYRIHNMPKKMMRIVASAACVLGVLAVCLGVVGYRNNLKAEETDIVTRGVIDSLDQIPMSKKNIYNNGDTAAKLGTRENPFLILEIVPYEEYAEFGYQISGCEPIDLSKVGNHMPDLSSLNTATIEQQTAYFFQEEPEANADLYIGNDGKSNLTQVSGEDLTKSYEGYYERVAEGEGYFKQNPDTKEIEFANTSKNKGGNIIWHTMCSKEKEVSKQKEFLDNPSEGALLEEIGDRVYTKRTSSEADPVMITHTYYYYKNNDNFLTHTMELEGDQVDNYSIVVKTITPKELNENPEWADYADLYIVSPTNHVENLPKVWQKYHRDGRTVTKGNILKSFINTNDNKNRDLSWNVIDKMYQKINAEKNYAPIIMDAHVYTTKDESSDPYVDICSSDMKSDMPGATKYDALRKGSNLEIYDWNLKKTGSKYSNASDAVCNNNVYKLAVMLFSMRADMFQSLYLGGGTSLNGKNSYVKNGKFELRTGQDQDYWSIYTFLPADANGDFDTSNPYKSWTESKYWDNFESAGNISASARDYINNRVFTFNSGTNTTQNYLSSNVLEGSDSSRYKDFRDYMEKQYPNGFDKATPSDAVRYILNYKNEGNETIEGTLNILDIEPSYDSKDGYSLTKKYIQTMIPKFKGQIKITHMTTAEFIGTTQDLNSTYNMIFIGRDDGAYNKSWDGKTVWNDSNMNGLIYFHTGDKMQSTEYYKYDETIFKQTGRKENWTEMRTVQYLVDSNGNKINSTELRFPGNDITKLKKKELESFLNAGYPIVSVPYAYDGSLNRIDQHSVLYSFINANKEKSDKKEKVYCSNEINGIYSALKKSHPSIEFTKLPNIYNGETSGTQISASTANYLEREDNGRGKPKLDFSFKINDKENHQYRCKIYVDQNQDGKFDSDEVFYNANVVYDANNTDDYTVKCRLSRMYMGVVNWKIELYQIGNKDIHITKSGISAVQRLAGTQKRKIKVLQIIPKTPTDDYDDEKESDINWGNFPYYSDWIVKQWRTPDGTKWYRFKHPYYGYMNLSTTKLCSYADDEFNNLFQKYYDQLDDYDIEVKTMTLQEYEKYFTSSNKFNYDYSQKVTDIHSVNMSDGQKKLYDDYNMYILGFGDAFAFQNLSNTYGAVDFLKFYIASGKSVLFTHDMTSLYNVRPEDFGYTANTLLRDVMGMNRYGAISEKTDRQKLLDYRANYNIKYDDVKDANGNILNATHGYTYYALKRLGWTEASEQWHYNNQKMPYKYLITNKYGEAVCGASDFARNSGFNNNNDLTTTVTKTNTGQITQYPYKIDDSFTVAKTHAQWYQLDMEDSEVTTWYCLGDDEKATAWNATDCYGDGTAGTYGISPNDAANNYYIYSKGNVFYSGIGHWTTSSDMEAKLFINTMIAAYRTTYEPPMIEILNDTTSFSYDEEKNIANYEISDLQEYDENNTTLSSSTSTATITGDGTIPEGGNAKEYTEIHFRPVEVNAASTMLNCSIHYKDTNQYIKTIYHIYYDDEGNKKVEKLTAHKKSENSEEWIFDNEGKTEDKDKINNMDEYYFYYPNAYQNGYTDANGVVNEAKNKMVFKIRNNKSRQEGTTNLDITTNMLFLLD